MALLLQDAWVGGQKDQQEHKNPLRPEQRPLKKQVLLF